MPKAIDDRQCSSIFPEFIELTFKNDPGATADNKNRVTAKAKFRLMDANKEFLVVRVLESVLWEGTQELTLTQVTNNLESALGNALTQARISLTGA